MDFTGTFDHTLDAKHRLTVPSKFRSALAGKVFLVRGADPCISVYPASVYTAIADEALARLNPLSPQAKQLRRFFYSMADDLELDGAGRITLNAIQLEHAQMKGREAVIAGAGESLEIWARDAWERYEADLTTQAPDLTAALVHPA